MSLKKGRTEKADYILDAAVISTSTFLDMLLESKAEGINKFIMKAKSMLEKIRNDLQLIFSIAKEDEKEELRAQISICEGIVRQMEMASPTYFGSSITGTYYAYSMSLFYELMSAMDRTIKLNEPEPPPAA